MVCEIGEWFLVGSEIWTVLVVHCIWARYLVNQSIPRITLKWLIGSIIRSVSRMWYCIWRGLLLSCWLVLSSSPQGLVICNTARTIGTARLHLEFSNEGSQDEWLCRPWINWSINKYEVDVSNTCDHGRVLLGLFLSHANTRPGSGFKALGQSLAICPGLWHLK